MRNVHRPLPLVVALAILLAIGGAKAALAQSSAPSDAVLDAETLAQSKTCVLFVCASNGQVSVGALVLGESALIAHALGYGTALRAAIAGLSTTSTLGPGLYPVLPAALIGAAGWFAWSSLSDQPLPDQSLAGAER